MKKKYVFLFLSLFSITVFSQDVGVVEITSPTINTTCGNTTETLIVTFKPDYSITDYFGTVPCYYQLNSDAIVQEDLHFASFFSLTESFTQEISPIDGMNTLRVWTNFPGDPDASNDEVILQFDYNINDPVAPWSETVEGFPEAINPGSYLDCWEFYSVGVDDQPDPLSTWGIVDLNSFSNPPMPSSGTKVFSPTLKSNFFSSLYLESPEIDISTLNLAELSFEYHVYGRFQGQLSVDIFHNGAWVEDIYIMNDEERQLEVTDPWRKKIILLDAYDGVVKIRFKYLDPDWVAWYAGDYDNGSFTGIDTIEVKEAPTCPSPENITIRYDEITKDTANITWQAGHVETDWEIEYGVVGFTPGTGTTVQTTQASYTITGLTAGTDYDVYVQAVCGAMPGTNDSALIASNFQTVCAFTAPWTENVESHLGTTRGMIENCWKTTTYDTHEYRWDIVNSGTGTPSAATGPLQPYEGTHYFHIESSIINGGNSFMIAPGVSTIYSPFIDVSGLTTPALKFYYHMYGANIGSLRVDVFHNGSWTDDVHVISGEQQTASSDPWGTALVDLSAFSGEIRLRFKGMSSTASPFSSDTAIDLIRLDEFLVLATPEVNLDLGIVMYPNPVDDFIHIESKQAINTLKIFSIEGKLLLDISAVSKRTLKIPATDFDKGVYFIEVTSNQQKQVIKMLKN